MIISEIQLRSMIRNLLLEGSALDDRKEFDELVEAGVITSDDLALIFNGNNPTETFEDPITRMVTLNTLKAGQDYSVKDIERAFGRDFGTVLRFYKTGELSTVDTPEDFPINDLIDTNRATCDDLKKYMSFFYEHAKNKEEEGIKHVKSLSFEDFEDLRDNANKGSQKDAKMLRTVHSLHRYSANEEIRNYFKLIGEIHDKLDELQHIMNISLAEDDFAFGDDDLIYFSYMQDYPPYGEIKTFNDSLEKIISECSDNKNHERVLEIVLGSDRISDMIVDIKLSPTKNKKTKLTSFPEWLMRLKNLERLDLRNNELTIIPDWIASFDYLVELDLSFNNIKSLPESIGNLKNLEGLKLKSNPLITLPESIGNLKNLEDLDLSVNRFKGLVLPESIGNLAKLKKLNLSNSNRTIFPNSAENLINLETLIIDENQLTELPEWIKNLKNLKKLYAQGNLLTRLPEWMGNLPYLSHMFLSSNRLNKVPESFNKLPSIVRLDLHYNPISDEEKSRIKGVFGKKINMR